MGWVGRTNQREKGRKKKACVFEVVEPPSPFPGIGPIKGAVCEHLQVRNVRIGPTSIFEWIEHILRAIELLLFCLIG